MNPNKNYLESYNQLLKRAHGLRKRRTTNYTDYNRYISEAQQLPPISADEWEGFCRKLADVLKV